ncbi:MAG: protein translocase subunit SecF [Firmicutes bacterium]|nr:protein translocase subunit SecF [Bacillota bacterium]
MTRSIDFVHRWRIWFAISGTLIVVAVLSLALRGLNYGIDFTGGTQFDLTFHQAVSTAAIRRVLDRQGVHGSTIVYVGHGRRQVLITTPNIPESTRNALLGQLSRQVGPYHEVSTDRVSATIGRQTERTALLAVLVATVAIVGYITLRFEFRFAVAAIVALIHDVVISVGLIALIHIQLTVYFVMAVLTIFGYSVNDTIIIFDRIRENLGRRKKGEPLDELVNRSLNQVLVRSINTSSTVLIALLALFLFGGSSIKDFTLTMLLGVFFGTYSSIFIASPLWLLWRGRAGRVKGSPRVA